MLNLEEIYEKVMNLRNNMKLIDIKKEINSLLIDVFLETNFCIYNEIYDT